MNFKGVILAGGRGSRLSPLTDVYNKFLCPVYDKLMIEYSVLSLAEAGIKEIAIILGTKSAGETMDYLKSGAKYGVKFTYFYQDTPLGVPHALLQAREWAKRSKIIVLCADNILYDNIETFIGEYLLYGNRGALITTKRFDNSIDLQRFAVLNIKDNKVVSIVEKPVDPPSNFAFCGIQIYDHKVWDIIDTLKLSPRGEYEITDVLNEYIRLNQFKHSLLRDEWFDCGTKESLFAAQEYAYYYGR